MTAPLFSFTARGQIGKAIVYSVWKGVAYVRAYVIPGNPQSADQVIIRDQFAEAVLRWADLTAGQKTTWGEYVEYWGKSAMSGFNIWVSEYITYIRAEEADPPENPWEF